MQKSERDAQIKGARAEKRNRICGSTFSATTGCNCPFPGLLVARCGGLTETFQSAESMFGTQTNVFMVRFTTILAVIFLSTSLILAFNSSKGDKSLMVNKKLLSTVAIPPAAPETSTPSKDVPVSPVTNATK